MPITNRLLRCTLRTGLLVTFLALVAGPSLAAPSSVKEVMDSTVTRLYATMDEQQLADLTDEAAMALFSAEELKVLATKHWAFDTDVPVTVSVVRDTKQAVVPFWLPQAGFEKTNLVVRNEDFTYEVWRKDFAAGRVELGINGFDNHRPHYFVCVGPRNAGEKATLTKFLPANQVLSEMRKGAHVYHDWPDLIFSEVPKELEGQILLQTIRGRSRDAHLVKAFRKTAYPSSDKPDQVVLTWSGDPKTTQTIQWRTGTVMQGAAFQPPKESLVHYREKAAAADAWKELKAKCEYLDDRLLMNDRWITHLTAEIEGLKPGTEYVYTVGTDKTERTFATAPAGPKPFSFAFLTDTHHKPESGRLLTQAVKQFPDLAFETITGDIVSTGLYRNEWDDVFEFGKDVYCRKPFMPALGNHDNQDGLGPALYLSLFDLPKNGPKLPELERAYSFEYANALFVMLDVTADLKAQTPWLDQQLAQSKAQWKFVILHFSPYCLENDEPDLVKEWCPVFDKHHVDFVLGGHVHYYMRSKPIKEGRPVGTPGEGTIYLINISIDDRDAKRPPSQYTDVQAFDGKARFVAFSLDGPKAVMNACDESGKVLDTLTVSK